jgi:hypothetical protein
MSDGTRLAVDVFLPDPLPPGGRVPALAEFHRYWRGNAGESPGADVRYWVRHGYAVVKVDLRGTGASFGVWRYTWSDEERRDIGEVLRWIAGTPWSDGQVVSTGVSYLANTAQLAATTGEPALRAVAPRAFDFDLYADLAYPGGVRNQFLLGQWAQLVGQLDANQAMGPGGGVRPVDGPEGTTLLAAAVRQHAANVSVDEATRGVVFRDDVAPLWGVSFEAVDLRRFQRAAEQAAVPVQGWGSWLDAGTANGILARFLSWQVPQEAWLGPWSHGARFRTDVFGRADTATVPTSAEQRETFRCFFEQHLDRTGTGAAGARPATRAKVLHYFTMGSNEWRETDVWPPRGMQLQRWFFAEAGTLRPERPSVDAAGDRYPVNFSATTGRRNRWYTQLSGGPVDYPGRAQADSLLLTYTSAPLDRDTEITGHPVVGVSLRSTTTDGHLFAYLEAVSPAGEVRYLTEGMLRLLHRREQSAPSVLPVPRHSFRREDARPMVPGQVASVRFGLLPTSVVVPRGWRLRLALGGADADTFERFPADATPTYTIERGRRWTSWVDVPVIARPVGAPSGR